MFLKIDSLDIVTLHRENSRNKTLHLCIKNSLKKENTQKYPECPSTYW